MEKEEPAQPRRRPDEYEAPRLQYLGSIGDLTHAEGSGPGGLGFAPNDPRGWKGHDVDRETARRVFGSDL
jgi:hypothetical protein